MNARDRRLWDRINRARLENDNILILSLHGISALTITDYWIPRKRISE